jgi:hypothetical protein
MTCLLSYQFYDRFVYGILLWNLVGQEAGSETTESITKWQYLLSTFFLPHIDGTASRVPQSKLA